MMCMLETWSVYFFHSFLSPFDYFFFLLVLFKWQKKREKKGVTHITHIPRVLFFFYLPFFNCLQDRCKSSENASEHILKDTQVDSLT